jgi:hypothetical protein
LSGQIRLKIAKQEYQFLAITAEGLAMVREWKRDEPPTGDPTVNAGEDQSVFERLGGRRSGKDTRLIVVCTAEGFKPANGVKNGRAGMPVDQLTPPGVGRRIDLINVHRRLLKLLSAQPRAQRNDPRIKFE